MPIRPRPAAAAKKPRRAPAKLDLAEVARVYIDAVTNGRRPIDALCEHFGVERSAAKNWPLKCRAAGLLPPIGQPVVHSDAPHHFVAHGTGG